MSKDEQLIVPCLWFDDVAEEAANFYTRLLPDGRVTAVSHYPESADNPAGKPRGSVLTVEFEVAGQTFTALDGGPDFTINPSISFFVHVDTAGDAERLFAAFADGGQTLMALGEYPWSEKYGWVKDRYGGSWQVIPGPRPAAGSTIAPCLMFTGPRQGRAEEAMRAYAGIFPGARVDHVERYAAGEGPEGTVKHGRMVIGDQDLVAMDSHIDNRFTFNEAVSLQVLCRDQAEVDRYWAALSRDGEPGPCGWLKDRFGVSWQIVPRVVTGLLTSKDAVARDRAFDAIMHMNKLDIATIEAAFAGAPSAPEMA